MSELKAVLVTTTTSPDTSWKTMTPLTHSCSNDSVAHSVLMRCFEVVEISDACFVHFLLHKGPHAVKSTGFKSGELWGHSSGEMNSGIFSFHDWHFYDVKRMSSLQVVMILFIFFQLLKMSRWIVPEITKICRTLLNLCLKCLSNSIFFGTRCRRM